MASMAPVLIEWHYAQCFSPATCFCAGPTVQRCIHLTRMRVFNRQLVLDGVRAILQRLHLLLQIKVHAAWLLRVVGKKLEPQQCL